LRKIFYGFVVKIKKNRINNIFENDSEAISARKRHHQITANYQERLTNGD
jgi:hypothetical protein